MLFFDQSYFTPQTVEAGYVSAEGGGIDRIYAQYRNKPKAVRWYEITNILSGKIASTASLVRVMYDIDAAYGELLDIIGRIVVVPRQYIKNVSLNPGVFAEPDGAEFGDESAQFSNLTIDTDDVMSDEIYRLVIKSKILKNNSDATIESILRGANFLLPNAQVVRLVDGEDMSFSLEFYGQISDLERWTVMNADLIPKPQGVRFNGFLEGYDYLQFGDITGQFGDEAAQFVGFTGV